MPLDKSSLSMLNVRTKGGILITVASLCKQVLTDPAAADPDGIAVDHAGADAAGTTYQTIGGILASGGVATMDYPRNVVIVVEHASAVVAMSGVITGLDDQGKVMTEAWSVTAGGVSKTFTGKKAFKNVTSITEVVAADASANTIRSGSGQVFGLKAELAVASAVKEIVDGAVVTNGTFVAASTAAADDVNGTYSPNTAPDGAHDYTVYYISDNPTQSR